MSIHFDIRMYLEKLICLFIPLMMTRLLISAIDKTIQFVEFMENDYVIGSRDQSLTKKNFAIYTNITHEYT